MTRDAPARIFQLDVLRGIAVLLVMGIHLPAYPLWNTFAWMGVDLFFVLSGFLISNLLFTEYRNTGSIRLLRFLARRALKLYPSFYLLLASTVLYFRIEHLSFSGRGLLGELLLSQNYIGRLWGHTWSLAVEEHFYIFLPLLLALLMRRNRTTPFRNIPYIFLAVAIGCLALRCATTVLHPVFDHNVHYVPTHLRMDSLFFGVFLSYCHNFRPEILRTLMSSPWRMPVSWVSVAAFIPVAFLHYDNPIVYTIGFTLVYIGFGTMLLLSLYKESDRKRAQSGFLVRSIGKMGIYSYTIYLWHVPLAQIFGDMWIPAAGTLRGFAIHAVYMATCIVVGVVTAKIVELPILRIRDRIFPVIHTIEFEKKAA